MNVAYCTVCQPPKAIGVGPDIKGAKHRVDGKEHTGVKIITVAYDGRNHGEGPDQYLERMGEKHKGELDK